MKRDTLDELAKAFGQLDKDSSGNIYKEELEDGPPEVYRAVCSFIGITSSQIIRTFEMLDYNNRGELTIKKFRNGILMLVLSELVELNILRIRNHNSTSKKAYTQRDTRMATLQRCGFGEAGIDMQLP